MSGAIAPIAQALFESLYPLVRAAEHADDRQHLLRQLGWDEDAAAELLILGPQVVNAWQRGLEQQADLTDATQAKDGERESVAAMLLLEVVFELSDAIAARAGQPSDGPLQPEVRDALWNDLALALPEYLLLRWLRVYKPLLYWALRITDVIEIETVDGTAPARLPAEVPRLRLERLGPLLSEPEAYLRGRYDWGFDPAALSYAWRHDADPMAPMRHGKLLQVLARLCSDLGLKPRLSDVHQRYIRPGGSGGTEPFVSGSAALAGARQLTIPLVQGRTGNGPCIELGVEVLPLPGSRGRDTVDGLYLTNLATSAQAGSHALAAGWTLQASAGVDASGAMALRLLPGHVALDQALPDATFELLAIGQPDEPWVLLGSASGSRLELRGARAGLSVLPAGREAELRVSLSATTDDGGPGLVLTLSPGDGDGFVQQLLGGSELEVPLALDLLWSSLTGLTLGGEIGFCITLPMQLAVGPVTLDEIKLCATAGPDGLALVMAATAGAHLGSIVCSVKEAGIEFLLGWSGATPGDAFGALTFAADFKPPAGIGLGVDSPAVTAGGYLEYDRTRGEYGGTATLGVGPLVLTAVGLLDANLPEPPGWSLLLSICAEFVPVPLGFGFTLNGVGGLVGIGRTIDIDALQRQLAAGALDAVMFPEDPVGQGPAIVDAIRLLFPVASGQTVFGPMVQIGWGAPTLIEADLGVLIELPDPVRIALVGQVASHLPTKDAALVELHLDALGTFNLTTLELSIDAALYDSWMVGYTLSGSMAVRASFGAEPNFLLAIGGFNPRFQAPPSFPTLRPVSIGLRFDDNLRIEAQSYFALTSNTIQFGAGVVVVAKLSILALEGQAGFDAIVTYSPFSFAIDFDASLGVFLAGKELLGVSIASTLRGPQPWFFSGEATFRVLSKDWRFDVAIQLAGNKVPVDLEPVDVAALVREALRESGAWTQPPAATGSGVRLAAPVDSQSEGDLEASALPTLMLRPDLAVEMRQRTAPLGITIEKFGNHPITGPSTISIDSARFGTLELDATQLQDNIEDWFAPGEYFTLDKTEQITAPSFEQHAAGKRLDVSGFDVGSACERSLAHEASVIDRDLDRKLARRNRPRRLPGLHSALELAVRNVRVPSQAIQSSAPQASFARPRWKLIDTASAWTSGELRSYAESRMALVARQLEHPHLQGQLRVVPASAGKPA